MVDVLFINSTDKFGLRYEANGTMLLSTLLLKAGIQAKILRFCQFEKSYRDYPEFIKAITEEILSISPKCISFLTLWPYYHMMLRIAKEIRAANPNITIIFAGPQASFTAKATMEAMDFVDYICTGEGENTVVPFFSAVLSGDFEAVKAVSGLYYRNNGTVCFNSGEVPLCDLDNLPYWDDRLWADDYTESQKELSHPTYHMPIDAGRGCPFKCTFCCTSSFLHRTYRMKSAERIIRDIKYYKERFGIRSFNFSHDALTVNKKLITEICDRIIEEKLDIIWKCTSRIDCIDEELVLKMKQAGLVCIEFGIETGSERMQQLIHKKLNLDKVLEKTDFLLKNGIRVNMFFIYGLPEETEEDLNKTLDLAFNLIDKGISYASLSLCRFNPATVITNKYFDDLVLDPEMKILTRGLSSGYAEEYEIIKNHKELFPFFYHLDTPLRRDYQYLEFLMSVYKRYPYSIKYLRSLYKGDNLKFYRDFYDNNTELFKKAMPEIERTIYSDSFEAMCNTMANFDFPYIEQLKALMKFDADVQKVKKSKEDTTMQVIYDFSYIDFQLKRPIEEYSKGQSEILIQKKNGKMFIKALQIT